MADAQDTGNPVLDSMVNLFRGHNFDEGSLRKVYAVLSDLAQKEPGGLKRRGWQEKLLDCTATTKDAGQ